MGANHGEGMGANLGDKFYWEGWQWTQFPQQKQVLAPPLFVI